MNLRGKLCPDCDIIWKEEMRKDSAKRYGKISQPNFKPQSKEKQLIDELAEVKFEDL